MGGGFIAFMIPIIMIPATAPWQEAPLSRLKTARARCVLNEKGRFPGFNRLPDPGLL
jgi:hypothetical protein